MFLGEFYPKNRRVSCSVTINLGRVFQKSLSVIYRFIAKVRNNITSDGFKNIEKTPLTFLKILRASYNKIDHQAINKIIQCDWPNLIEL